jgi:hypothetical protein
VITLAACAALTDYSRSDIADDSTYRSTVPGTATAG